MFSKVKATSKHLHRNKKGDIPVGTILLIGAVVIPLILLLVTYQKNIMGWLDTQTTSVTQPKGTGTGTGTGSGPTTP